MATSVKMTPGQLGIAIRNQGKKMPDAIARGARIGAERGRSLLVSKSPTFDGHFRNAWQAKAPGGAIAGVVNSAPYAGIIERGARPHAVSLEGQAAIREWFRRKVGLSGKELDAAVRGFVFKLREKGQKGTFLVRNHLGELKRFVVDEIVDQIKREIGGGP